MRYLFSIILFLVSAASAKAHLGHLGEVAGHSHWIALGAGAVAAAIAAALGKRKLAQEKAETGEETEDEPDTEAAGAKA